MEFIESNIFTKLVNDYLSDDEYNALQWYLALNPEAGDLVPGSGGLRKVRWKKSKQGKSSGVRVIYYYQRQDKLIWLLTIYSKNETANIAPNILRKIKEALIE